MRGRGFISKITNGGGLIHLDNPPHELPPDVPFSWRDTESLLPNGERVQFDVAIDRKGAHAVNVQRGNARPN